MMYTIVLMSVAKLHSHRGTNFQKTSYIEICIDCAVFMKIMFSKNLGTFILEHVSEIMADAIY